LHFFEKNNEFRTIFKRIEEKKMDKIKEAMKELK